MIEDLSLPHRSPPLPGDSIVGTLLRAASNNGLDADDVARDVLVGITPEHFGRLTGCGYLAEAVDLDRLGVLLPATPASLRAMTLRDQLRRLFGNDVDPRAMGKGYAFRVCPPCLGDAPELPLEWTFPRVVACVRHHVRLVTQCACGARLTPFRRGAKPFTCGCGRAWSTLPVSDIDAHLDLSQRKVRHAYDVFLERAQPPFFEAVRAVLSLDGPPRWTGDWCDEDLAVAGWRLAPRWIASVASAVAAFVARQIPPERVLEVLPLPPDRRTACRNTQCPFAGSTEMIRHNGARHGEWESYCAFCGSRYLGERMILSFDADNGCPELSETAVARARARLASWHRGLSVACLSDEVQGRLPVHVGDVFRLAGIPNNANLRAPRLGLVGAAQELLGTARLGGLVLDEACRDVPVPSPRWGYVSR